MLDISHSATAGNSSKLAMGNPAKSNAALQEKQRRPSVTAQHMDAYYTCITRSPSHTHTHTHTHTLKRTRAPLQARPVPPRVQAVLQGVGRDLCRALLCAAQDGR